MELSYWTVVALALVLVTSPGCYAAHEGRRGDRDPQEGLELSAPKEMFRSDGGSLEVWSSNFRVLQDASVGAARITLEPRGLGLFQYSDSSQLVYVLKGQAKVGLSYPWDQSVHIQSVKQGDVIAIPRGVGHWWYNSGDRRFMVFSVADTSNGANPGEYDVFYLNGGADKDWGSVLHGFDEELLSHAWDVESDVVRQIRGSQKGTVIVKVNEDMEIPRDSGSDESDQFWANYTYNIDEAQPDIDVNNGGSFSMLTNKQLPILRELRLSAIRVKLDREALLAPSYASNAHRLVYITRGSGRIQIIGSGDQLLDSDVREGCLVVVPEFHPDIMKAGKDGLEFVAIATSDMPIFSFLAGKNALDRNMPVEVLAAGNNVPVKVQQKILDHRRHDAVIFPPRGKSGSPSKEAINKLNGLFFTHFEELQAVMEKKMQIQF